MLARWHPRCDFTLLHDLLLLLYCCAPTPSECTLIWVQCQHTLIFVCICTLEFWIWRGISIGN